MSKEYKFGAPFPAIQLPPLPTFDLYPGEGGPISLPPPVFGPPIFTLAPLPSGPLPPDAPYPFAAAGIIFTLDDAAVDPTNWRFKVFPTRAETTGRAILADAAIPCLGPVHAQLHGEFARGFDGDPPWLPHEAERRIRYLVDTLLQVVPWLQSGKTEGDR